MRNVKCIECAEYINEWCRKVKDSPYPDLIRDCEYFHDIEINVEKIIRCRDCKAYLPETETLASYCPILNILGLPEDAYCYKAQKREE